MGEGLNFSDVFMLIIIVLIAIAVVYILYQKFVGRRSDETKELMEKTKQELTVYVIDKKFERPTPANTSAAVYERIKGLNKRRKIGIIRGKVGPKVYSFMCNKDVYNVIPVRKNVKVMAAGLYIISVVGINLADKKKKSMREKMLSEYINK